MAEEEIKDNGENKLSFKTADELSQFLLDLQGQISNLNEIVDKMKPVEEPGEGDEEGGESPKEEKISEEELNEIDRLLQSE